MEAIMISFNNRDKYVRIFHMSPNKNLSPFETMLCSDQLKNKMMRVAMSMTQKNKTASLDLIQNTYLKALEKEAQFAGDNIDPWVITILRNLFIDSTRQGTFTVKEITKDFEGNRKEDKKKVKREYAYGDDLPDVIVAEDSETGMIENELNQQRDVCMKSLSNDEIQVIALHQDSSYDEISLMMDMKPGTIRQIKKRGMEKFIVCMGFNNE
jgi:RNA polymerase sigma factor (sigma-70 family)